MDADDLTPTQVAEIFGVTPATVRYWCRQGYLECRTIAGRVWIPNAAVQPLLEPPRPLFLLSKPFVTVTEAARVLQINRHTLVRWCYLGKVPTTREGRQYRIARSTVNELMTRLQEGYQWA